MESENLLDTQWREFGKWFAFSILGIFIFYLSFYFYIKYIYRGKFALPISLLIIGIALTGHTIFLLHQSTFDFLKIYRFILFLFFIFITYILTSGKNPFIAVNTDSDIVFCKIPSIDE